MKQIVACPGIAPEDVKPQDSASVKLKTNNKISEELEELNLRARSLLLQNRRRLRTFLNSPPRFGYRGTGSAWIDRMQSA